MENKRLTEIFCSGMSIGTSKLVNTDHDLVIANPASDSISEISFNLIVENVLSVSSWDGTVQLFQINQDTINQIHRYNHNGPVLCSCWFPDGKAAVSGGCDNRIVVMDSSSDQTHCIGMHNEPISSVQVIDHHSSNPLIVSGSWDCQLKVWDPRQSEPVYTRNLESKIYRINHSNQLLVVATSDSKLHMFDTRNPVNYRSINSPLSGQTRTIACYPGGDGYCIGGSDGKCAVQYIDTNQQYRLGYVFRCHRAEQDIGNNITLIHSINDISFHPKHSTTFSTAGSDGKFIFWQQKLKKKLKASPFVGGSITSTGFNSTGDLFAYAVSYDWSKGYKYNHPGYPISVKVHKVIESDVTY